MIGSEVTSDLKSRLETQLKEYKLDGVQLDIHQVSAGQRIDVAGMQQQITADIRRSSSQQLEEHRSRISILERRLREVKRVDINVACLSEEIRAQYPTVRKARVSREIGTDHDVALLANRV